MRWRGYSIDWQDENGFTGYTCTVCGKILHANDMVYTVAYADDQEELAIEAIWKIEVGELTVCQDCVEGHGWPDHMATEWLKKHIKKRYSTVRRFEKYGGMLCCVIGGRD